MSALITLLVYAAVLVGIGLWTSQKAKSESSFILGERGLGPWVAGLAYAASSSSAWVLLGFSGFVYAAGPSTLWMVPGILAGYAVVWLWAGKMLQSTSKESGHLTLTDFIVETASPKLRAAIRVLISLLIAFCFSYYVSSQFLGAGLAFEDLFKLPIVYGVLLGAGIILAYTFFGGFLAVSLVDTLQGILIAIVAVVLPVAAFMEAGGISGISAALADTPDSYLEVFGGRSGMLALGFVVGLFATGFGALGQPHLIAWIMASRDSNARVTGAGVAIGWGALVYAGMAVLGLSARAIFGDGAPAEGIFFKLASDLLPSVFAGIVAAATLSAIMSTVDSQLLVAGAAIGHDLGLAKAFKGNAAFATRLGVLAVCAIAVVITLLLPATIFERTLFAWVALGASLGPSVVVRVLGLKPSGASLFASIAGGFIASLAFEFALPSGPGQVWARTVPWMIAFLPFVTDALSRKSEVTA